MSAKSCLRLHHTSQQTSPLLGVAQPFSKSKYRARASLPWQHNWRKVFWRLPRTAALTIYLLYEFGLQVLFQYQGFSKQIWSLMDNSKDLGTRKMFKGKANEWKIEERKLRTTILTLQATCVNWRRWRVWWRRQFPDHHNQLLQYLHVKSTEPPTNLTWPQETALYTESYETSAWGSKLLALSQQSPQSFPDFTISPANLSPAKINLKHCDNMLQSFSIHFFIFSSFSWYSLDLSSFHLFSLDHVAFLVLYIFSLLSLETQIACKDQSQTRNNVAIFLQEPA